MLISQPKKPDFAEYLLYGDPRNLGMLAISTLGFAAVLLHEAVPAHWWRA
jgi:preprotein translocase subunit Sss1